MNFSFNKENTSNYVIPLPRPTTTDLLMASFTTNFILSRVSLVCMLNFGPNLLVSTTCTTFLDYIILLKPQNKLTNNHKNISINFFLNLVQIKKLANESNKNRNQKGT